MVDLGLRKGGIKWQLDLRAKWGKFESHGDPKFRAKIEISTLIKDEGVGGFGDILDS